MVFFLSFGGGIEDSNTSAERFARRGVRIRHLEIDKLACQAESARILVVRRASLFGDVSNAILRAFEVAPFLLM